MTSIPRFLVDISRKRLRGDGQPGLPSWVSMQSSDVTEGKPSGLGGPWKPCSLLLPVPLDSFPPCRRFASQLGLSLQTREVVKLVE